MANTKEIQTRMNSIRDTMKITNAMYMISSAKLKHARRAMEESDPHFYAIQASIARILRHVPALENNIYFGTDTPADQKRVGYLVVTADKGLAGAYNHNVIKLVQTDLDEHPESELFVVGQTGRSYFDKKGYRIDRMFQYTAQNPSLHRARVISEELLVRYHGGDLDEIYIVYTRSGKGSVSEPEKLKLLPLSKTEFQAAGKKIRVADDTSYFPSAEDVMNSIVPNYVTGMIYGALVESFACEQNDRMMAMDAATGNATEMLRELQIEYNRVRQAAITQEITEVIAGAKVQKRKKANGNG